MSGTRPKEIRYRVVFVPAGHGTAVSWLLEYCKGIGVDTSHDKYGRWKSVTFVVPYGEGNRPCMEKLYQNFNLKAVLVEETEIF